MRIFITGANRGLGYELTKIALLNGHMVFAGAFSNNELGDLEELKVKFEKLTIIDLDVTSDASVEKAIEVINKTTDELDVVINNAGVLLDKDKHIDNLDIEEIKLSFDVNTFGVYRVLKATLPLLYKGKNQMIINISSEASIIGRVGTQYCSYSMTKVAVTMMNQMFANFLEEKGIKVYAIHPGRMNTVMGRDTAQIEPEESAKGIFSIIIGEKQPEIDNGVYFIDYMGKAMKL